EVHDFMPVGGEQRLIRRVVAVRGELRFRLECEPRFNYGRDRHITTLSAGGAHFRSTSLSLALGAPLPLTATTDGVAAEFTLKGGETASFVLSENATPLSEAESTSLHDETVAYWVDWIAQSQYSGRWREMVNRSALALKLLTYEPTGAIVAAPTASLPEQ